MNDLHSGALEIKVVDLGADAPLKLTWLGRSNDRHPASVLGPFFGQLLREAEQRGAPVELHFEKLEHFNSSTVSALIQVIQEAREKKVRLRFFYDGSLKWQKLSFDVLRVFVTGDDLLQIRS
jgi:hypothetical protein